MLRASLVALVGQALVGQALSLSAVPARWAAAPAAWSGPAYGPNSAAPAAVQAEPAATLAKSASAPQTIVVAGGTGRTGRLIVQTLLAKPGVRVRALVRDLDRAADVLGTSDRLELVKLDLGAAEAAPVARGVCDGAEAVLWCATGFADDGTCLDVKWVPALAAAIGGGAPSAGAAPRLVMLSSAGVTRPAWDAAKSAALVGASDIPIIRLNPGGILGAKCEAEAALRTSGTPYCVVRPTGLKDDWPKGRPILSQGDVAVGRANPSDVADVVVGVLAEPSAAGKTFEMTTLAGYPAGSLAPSLERLALDSAARPSEAEVAATYAVLQQLLPGESQDATKLEMGRTYEQLDGGQVAARRRGAGNTAREEALAAGVATGTAAEPGAAGRGGGKRAWLLGRAARLMGL